MGDSIVGKSISSLKPSQSMVCFSFTWKWATNVMNIQKIDTSTDNSDRLELAMRTFGEFNFNHTHLFTLIQCISEVYFSSILLILTLSFRVIWYVIQSFFVYLQSDVVLLCLGHSFMSMREQQGINDIYFLLFNIIS